MKNSRTTLAAVMRHDSAGNAIHNLILRDLPRKECNLVFDKLTLVNLNLRDLFQEAGQPIQYCYFPNTVMASILNLMTDGTSVEVGLVGREGFVGLPVLAGFRTSPNRINTQAAGTVFRLPAEELGKVLDRCPQLARALTRYSQEAAMATTQIAACNQLHNVDQRLARWLLMCRDRILSDHLPLTQEFLSQMLGIRRASVSMAAGHLQKAGLIRYDRGKVTIVNEAGLEKACCECYRAIQHNLENWKQESNGQR